MQEVLQLQPQIPQWQETGVEVVFATTTSAASMLSFMEEQDVIMQVLLDSGRRMHVSYGVGGIPATFVIDDEGVLRHTSVGWGPDSLRQLQQWVDGLTSR